MSTSTLVAQPEPLGRTWLPVVALAGLSLLVGVAIGQPDRGPLLELAAVLGGGLVLWAFVRPRGALWLLLTATITLPFFPVTSTRGANLVDVLLLPTLFGAWYWSSRSESAHPGGVEASRIHRGFVRAGMAYYGLALLSLFLQGARGDVAQALDSLLALIRSLQGVCYFYLVTRLVRSTRDLYHARNAMLVGLIVSLVVNVVGMTGFGVTRAGAAWNLLVQGWFLSGPNEAGFGVVFVWALILALPMKRWLRIPLLVSSVALLIATQSRSGILAWLTFVVLFGMRGGRRKVLLAPLALLLLFPLLPEDWTRRIIRTIFLERGTFEAYSSLIRLYAWKTALAMIVAHPLSGVGYLGFRFYSDAYNSLSLPLGTTENFLLETVAGQGLVGLLPVAWLGWLFHRLGGTALRNCPHGSAGYGFGSVTPPLLAATVVANMTGDILAGMMGVAQMSVFAGLLLQALRVGSDSGGTPQDRRA